MAKKEKKHKIEVEEDHGFFHFFIDLFKRRKKKRKGKKGPYHGFMNKNVYLAFKKQWGKSHKKKKKKVSIEFETAKQLREAANVIKHMKASTGTRSVFQKIRYIESLDDKIARVKQMLKHLEFEYFKRHINPGEYNRRKFEYMEALRYLLVQKRMQQKAAKEKKQVKPAKPGAAAVAGATGQPEGIAMPEPITIRAPKIRPRPIARPAKEEQPPKRIEKKIVEKLEKIEKKVEEIPKERAEKRPAEKEEPPTKRPEEASTKPTAKKEPPTEKLAPSPRAEETQRQTAESLAKIAAAVEKARPEAAKRPKIVAKEKEGAKPFEFRPRDIRPHKIAGAEEAKAPVQAIVLETPIDRLVQLLKKRKKMSFKSIANMLNWNVESVEKVGLVLEKQGVVDVHYPTMITAKPSISFLKELPPVERFEVKGRLVEEYGFVIDFVPANVRIYQVKEEQRPVYHLQTPYVGAYTTAFFEQLKDAIAEQIPIEVSEITDSKKSLELKKRFFSVAKQELQRYLMQSPKAQINVLAGLLLHSMYGLGKIEVLAGDNQLEEIAINSAKTPVTVYHKKYGWLQSTVFMPSEEDIFNYASQIGRKIGREINTLHPILDAHLLSGDRVNATLSPISSFGNTITIRRFARKPWTIVGFIGPSHTMNLQMASILWMAMQYEMSIIVAGGTASGKTSCLNALSAMIPAYHRVISIEDVREIMLPEYMHWNWVPLTTRNPNPEGMGEVSMLQLMQSSLRMRPDRIILGEIRRRKEAEVLFEAMHTGHSVYSTLHANSAQQVLRRLTEPPIALPTLQVEAVDLLLVQYRDRRKNIRRTYEISEIESGRSKEQISINTVFRWDPRSDGWESVNPATKLIRQLNLHTGMTQDEITKDLESRATILQWMQQHKLSEIEHVGQVMKLFYTKPDILRKAAESNEDPKKVFGEKR